MADDVLHSPASGSRQVTRSYRPVERQRAVDQGRERIIMAARHLLEDDEAETFSIDAVARHAGVSRMTIYNQFASKAGLLEALFDALAARGAMSGMPEVFAQPDPRAALDAFITVLGRFWTESRRAHGRLAAAAIIDPELAAAMVRRNERRRHGIAELVRRLSRDMHPVVPRAEVVNVLFSLLSFQTFHELAGNDRTPSDVVPLVRRLVYAVLGLSPVRRRRAPA